MCLFFVLCGSNFDLIFGCVYAIILLDSVDVVLVVTSKMTTYLTIDSSGAHGNNGYKIVKEDLTWSGNGYKKPFAAERTISALFGSREAAEGFAEQFSVYFLLHYTVTVFSFRGNLGRKSV